MIVMSVKIEFFIFFLLKNMTRFGRIEIQKAIDQITNHYVSVKLPRLSEEEIAAYTR